MKRGPTEGRWQLRFDWAGAPSALPLPAERQQPAMPRPASRVYALAESPLPLPGEHRAAPTRQRRIVHPRIGSRAITTMPVPRPLPDAIADGHFGLDAAGKPSRPTQEEVRSITESHADKLIDLLLILRDATERDPIIAAFAQGIAEYVASFGERAGERLRAYVTAAACVRIPVSGRGR